MFHDEMQSVRLRSVESLAKMGAKSLVQVNETQLMYILTAFIDEHVEMRRAACALLHGLSLDSLKSLRRCVDSVILSAQTKGLDSDGVKALIALGKNHPDFVGNFLWKW